MARWGKHKRPFYRIVVADRRFPRDGRFLEVIGTYDPLAQEGGVHLNTEKLNEWIKKGAQPSNRVKTLTRKLVQPAAT